MQKQTYAILEEGQSELLRNELLILFQKFIENPTNIEIYDQDADNGDHCHSYWEMRLIRRYEQGRFEKFILVAPTCRHAPVASQVYDKSFMLQLRSGYLQGVFYNHNVVDLRDSDPKFDILSRVFQLLVALKKSKMPDSFLCYYVKAAVMHLIDLFSEKWGVPPPRKGHTFEQAWAYLRENLRRTEFSVSDIAQYLGISPYYVSKLFVKNTGVSAQRYLIFVRLQTACELLIDGYTAVGDVANLSGWSNHSYFSSSFKKIVGITPMEFYRSPLEKQKKLKKKLDNVVIGFNKHKP
jgi:AraC-like DNA-binding protein